MRALAPLVSAVRSARPGLRLAVSAQTPHGRAMGARLFPDLPVGHPPLDCPPWPGRALRHSRVRLLVLEYLELWPAWISAAVAVGVPVVVVDGRVGPRTLRARRLLGPTAARLTAFAARSEPDADAARRLGVPPDRVHVLGNGKHDGVSGAPPQPDEGLRRAIGPVDVVLGSLHPDEEAEALPALAASGLRTLIAPRYPARVTALLRAARRLGISARRRSQPTDAPAQWIILDTIGELAAAYALGRVAVVGGTFGRRDGQNLIEPAAHGRPVVHGPRTANVAEEAAALSGRGAHPVRSWADAVAACERLLVEPGPDPRPALRALRGATARNVDLLLAVLEGRC
jgi:3-deoxy-D-manno-octulosonic-acid transferase